MHYSHNYYLFNIALEKTVKVMQKNKATKITTIDHCRNKILGFIDNFNMEGNTNDNTERAVKLLEKATGKIGLGNKNYVKKKNYETIKQIINRHN